VKYPEKGLSFQKPEFRNAAVATHLLVVIEEEDDDGDELAGG
jgi:hypothetical protein